MKTKLTIVLLAVMLSGCEFMPMVAQNHTYQVLSVALANCAKGNIEVNSRESYSMSETSFKCEVN